MKKLLKLGSLLMLFISSFTFAQTGGCTPTFPMLPKPIKDKIDINYDTTINQFGQDNTKQMAVIKYLEEFDNALNSGKAPTTDDYTKLSDLKKMSATNATVVWINQAAESSATFDIFLEKIGKQISSTKNVEELNILVITSYQLQIVNNTYKDATNPAAKCSGWWSCWGKCAAGIVGGAAGGALGGAAAGAPVAGVGAVPGAIIGGIAGGLTGASQAC